MKTLKFLLFVAAVCFVFTFAHSIPLDERITPIPDKNHEHSEGCGHPFDKIKEGLSKIKESLANTVKNVKDTYREIKEKLTGGKPTELITKTEEIHKISTITPSTSKLPYDSGFTETNIKFENDGSSYHDTGFATWENIAPWDVNKGKTDLGPSVFENTSTGFNNVQENWSSASTVNIFPQEQSVIPFNTGLENIGPQQFDNAESTINQQPSLLQPPSESNIAQAINPRRN
ncbi:hypothetical protein PGB90_010433 [Kerria lacca]